MRVDDALAWGTAELSGQESPALDCRVLLCHVLDKPASFLFTWPEHVLTAAQQQTFCDLIAQRKTGTPVAYLTGQRDFWTLSLATSPSTLIPRPETELLVEAALERLPATARRVCDLGIGTGAVALAIAAERPELEVTGVDVVEEAVKLAQHNAQRNHISNARFVHSHWFDALNDSYDMIVSNPPYVEHSSVYLKQGDVRFEPLSALISGEDGLDDIRYLIPQAKGYLNDGGSLLLEHGFAQGEAIRALFTANGYTGVTTLKDFAGHDRVSLGFCKACD
ncbi:peptide chain release factor N(5)-glutamine methyltransferase [Alteromonas sp. CYL-A6]|uniref:peptide chain release factor N(5)-glutamine methyltransferase n=1 Tax=Alteromonas nitratireducens TaxID=3390813 RepID=UPI0034BB8576